MFLTNFYLKKIHFNPIRSFSKLKMSSKCMVAVCQLTATNNKAENLSLVKSLILDSIKRNAKIVFLPEGCDYIGSNKEEAKSLAEPLEGPTMSQYKLLAKEYTIWLSVGGFHQLINKQGEKKYYNTHVLIDDKGEIRKTYEKIHLFDVSIPENNVHLKESDMTQCGEELRAPVSTPAGSLGLSICYDLRFPEMSILQRRMGVDILTFPSAFTHATGMAHWEVLLRARAVENQCYVVAAAQYGKHNEKRTSYGNSMIIDPWGKIIAECPKYDENHATNTSVAVAEIDLDLVKKVRREMPVMEHRRSDIYHMICTRREKLVLNDEDTFKFATKIIPGSTVFYKTALSFAFTNIRCVVPGHVLVTSIRPAKRLENLSTEEVSDLFQTVVKVQQVLEKVHSSESSTICVQDGKNAGQTVPHVHVHILPRQLNDFGNNDEIYDRLAKHDRDNNTEAIRSLEEMSTEAKVLRSYFS